MCEPGARHREYVYVWKSPSAPEVIVTPSISKLISEPNICVDSCTETVTQDVGGALGEALGCAQICSWMPPSQPQQYVLLTYSLQVTLGVPYER